MCVPEPDLEISTDDNGVVTSIFYQDGPMRKFFSLYPEVLLVDATYKLTNVRMLVYVLLGIGPNGESEIVAVFLTAHEDALTLQTVMAQFKMKNAAWNQVRTILTDKDMAEREAIRQMFPQASLLLCLFHVLRAMGHEVTTLKMHISEQQRGASLALLQRLAYANSENEYSELRNSLHATAAQSIVNYYEANWHHCRREWVLCWQRQNITFGERTTNRLESVNRRLKAAIKTGSSLPDFFRDLVATVACMRNERAHASLVATDKVSVTQYPAQSAHCKFSNALTPFARNLVFKQLKLASDMQTELPWVCLVSTC